jgi:hypothetical protein
MKSGEALKVARWIRLYLTRRDVDQGEPAITDFVQWGDDADTVVGDYLLCCWRLWSVHRNIRLRGCRSLEEETESVVFEKAIRWWNQPCFGLSLDEGLGLFRERFRSL